MRTARLSGRMPMNAWLCFVPALFGLATVGVAGQQVEPQEPGIVLPPVLLRVEDVSQLAIDVPLPEATGPTLPDIAISLPEASSLGTGAVAFNLPIPETVGTNAAGLVRPPASFFSEGEIGIGSVNHVIGDITLYKLGDSPRFNIHFSHERLDGYDFMPAGAGFFHQKDVIDGSLSADSEKRYTFDSAASYSETEEGLQKLTDSYSSVSHRFLTANLTGGLTSLAPYTFSASVKASSADVTLAGASPVSGSELAVNPQLSVSADLGPVELGASGFYSVAQTQAMAVQDQSSAQPATQAQRAGGSFTFTAPLPLSLSIAGNLSLHWDDFNGLRAPFSLGLSGSYRDMLTWNVAGGYRADDQSFVDLWTNYPFYDESGALHTSLVWFVKGESQVHLSSALGFSAGLEWDQASAAILPVSLDANGLFSFTQEAAPALSPTFALAWNPTGPFSLKAGWQGSFLNPSPLVPVSTLTLDASLAEKSLRYGGSLSGSLDVYSSGPQMPELNLSGFFRVSDGVIFNASIRDMLSPLIPGGRTLWNTYQLPGFNLLLETHVSL